MQPTGTEATVGSIAKDPDPVRGFSGFVVAKRAMGDGALSNGNGAAGPPPAVVAAAACSNGNGGNGGVEKVKFTVSVRGRQWSSARHVNETLEEFAAAIQVRAVRWL